MSLTAVWGRGQPTLCGCDSPVSRAKAGEGCYSHLLEPRGDGFYCRWEEPRLRMNFHELLIFFFGTLLVEGRYRDIPACNKIGVKRITSLTGIVMVCIKMLEAQAVDTVISSALVATLLPSSFSSLPALAPQSYTERCEESLPWCGKMSPGLLFHDDFSSTPVA